MVRCTWIAAETSSLLLLFCISSVHSFYLPGVAPRDFQKGDPLNVKVNKLSSTKTQLPYDYYFLKYCKPSKIENNAENLGEVLRGDRIENSVYIFEMGVDQYCRVACRVKLDDESAKNFKEKIDDEYRVNMILDNLPVAVLRQRKDERQSKTYEHGFRVGFKTKYGGSKKETYFINNHLSFKVMYHKDPESDLSRIVGFEVTPMSFPHVFNPLMKKYHMDYAETTSQAATVSQIKETSVSDMENELAKVTGPQAYPLQQKHHAPPNGNDIEPSEKATESADKSASVAANNAHDKSASVAIAGSMSTMKNRAREWTLVQNRKGNNIQKSTSQSSPKMDIQLCTKPLNSNARDNMAITCQPNTLGLESIQDVPVEVFETSTDVHVKAINIDSAKNVLPCLTYLRRTKDLETRNKAKISTPVASHKNRSISKSKQQDGLSPIFLLPRLNCLPTRDVLHSPTL